VSRVILKSGLLLNLETSCPCQLLLAELGFLRMLFA